MGQQSRIRVEGLDYRVGPTSWGAWGYWAGKSAHDGVARDIEAVHRRSLGFRDTREEAEAAARDDARQVFAWIAARGVGAGSGGRGREDTAADRLRLRRAKL